MKKFRNLYLNFKNMLLCCLWTFVEKMEDWRRISSSCLESLAQQRRRARPATKTC